MNNEDKNSSVSDNIEEVCFCCLTKFKNMHNINDKHKKMLWKLLKIEEKVSTIHLKYLCKSCNLQLQRSYRFLSNVEKSLNTIKIVTGSFKESETENGQQFKCPVCSLLNSSKKSLSIHHFCTKHIRTFDLLSTGYLTNYKVEENTKCSTNETLLEDEDILLTGLLQNESVEFQDISSDVCLKSETSVDSMDEINEFNVGYEEIVSTEPIENKKKVKLFCEICQKSYKTKSKFRMHIKSHTGDLPFKCQYCEKKFATKADTGNHERRHTKEKPFICNVCGKALSAASALRTHMKQHTGRPEKCEICNKSFCRKSELTLHMKKHEGDRPFLCTKCGSSFAQHSHLTEHLTIHTDDRPFSCNQCDKSFKKRTLLKQHQELHKGVKNFKCTKCPYACYKRYRLKQHTKIHGLETDKDHKSRMCPVCGKEYTTLSGLNTHVSSIHSVIV